MAVVAPTSTLSKSEPVDPERLARVQKVADAARALLPPLPTDLPVVPHAFDPDVGERAFAECHAALVAIDSTNVQTPRCDCGQVAAAALKLAAHIETPKVKQLFDLLPSALMGDATPDLLHRLAQALFFVDTRARSFVATQAAKRVDAALVAQGVAVRDRMLRVLAYHFHDHPLMMAELASIKGGSGYMDLASDLARVGTHYSSHRATLETDRVQYDARDENLSRGISHEIFLALSASEDRSILDLRNRAYTMTARVYGRLKEAGDFIFANDAAELEHFPPLRKAAVPKIGRPKGSRNKRPAPSAGEAPAPAPNTTVTDAFHPL